MIVRGLINSLRQSMVALPFILGSLITFAAVIVYPLLHSFWVSVHRWLFGRPSRPFIGLENYQTALQDVHFLQSLWVTSLFVVGSVLLSIVFGLVLAVLLNQRFPGKRFFRALLIIPFVMTPVIAGLIWKVFFYDSEFGLINFALRKLGLPQPAWLLEGGTALLAVVLTDVWNYTPMVMLVLGAAMAILPREPFEAARIDGATVTQQFFFLTLPMIRSQLVFIILFRITMSFKVFDIVHVMTGGGPGYDTRVISLYVYNTALRGLNMGYANAQSYLLMALIALVCLAIFRYGTRGVGSMTWDK